MTDDDAEEVTRQPVDEEETAAAPAARPSRLHRVLNFMADTVGASIGGAL